MGQILSQPVTDKATEKDEDARRVYGVSSMQGWRVSMEDAHAAELSLSTDPKVSFFAVYDGHGGERTAQFAGEKVHGLVRASPAFDKGDWAQALTDGFLGADDALLAQSHDEGVDGSGCAATSAIITETRIVCANAGDSRTVLGRRGMAKPLSFDHKPENEGERSRINAAGGFVEMGRVNANLALSRALGDFNFKNNSRLAPEQQVVTANPDIVEHTLDDSDEFVILACDGIWDCMTSQQAVEFVRRGIADGLALEEICELMMEECLAPESDMSGIGCDNMTVCIVALLQPGQTKEEWYASIAKRVEAGDGPVAQQPSEEVRQRLEERQRGESGSQGRSLPSMYRGDHGDEETEAMPDASEIVQQLFGGGDGVMRLNPDASSLLSRIGVRLNMHMPDDFEEGDEGTSHSHEEHKDQDQDDGRISEVGDN